MARVARRCELSLGLAPKAGSIEGNLSELRAFLRDVAWEPMSALLARPRFESRGRIDQIWEESGTSACLLARVGNLGNYASLARELTITLVSDSRAGVRTLIV